MPWRRADYLLPAPPDKASSLFPTVGAVLIEWEAARAVAEHERREPCFEAGSILKACRAFFRDTLPDLTERDHALKNKSVDGPDPSRVITLALGAAFVSSEMKFVSRRKLKARCAEDGVARV